MSGLNILGLTLVCTCDACPEQYDVYNGDTKVAYFRLRHGWFRVDVPFCGGETILSSHAMRGDGQFADDERLTFLTEGCNAVLHWMATLGESIQPGQSICVRPGSVITGLPEGDGS